MGRYKGFKVPKRVKEKMSSAHKGKNHSEETKGKMSVSMLKKWKEWQRDGTGRMKEKAKGTIA